MYLSRKWINRLVSEENKVSRTLFEARKVAGSAKYKQCKWVWNCVISLFIQSWDQREFVHLVCLGINKSVNENLSLLIVFSPKTTECTFKRKHQKCWWWYWLKDEVSPKWWKGLFMYICIKRNGNPSRSWWDIWVWKRWTDGQNWLASFTRAVWRVKTPGCWLIKLQILKSIQVKIKEVVSRRHVIQKALGTTGQHLQILALKAWLAHLNAHKHLQQKAWERAEEEVMGWKAAIPFSKLQHPLRKL